MSASSLSSSTSSSSSSLPPVSEETLKKKEEANQPTVSNSVKPSKVSPEAAKKAKKTTAEEGKVESSLPYVIQKIVQCVVRFFRAIAEFFSPSKDLKAFEKTCSYDAIFSVNPIKTKDGHTVDQTMRRYTTDVEQDDKDNFRDTFKYLSDHYDPSVPIPELTIIVKEGDDGILGAKIETFQYQLCALAKEGVIKEEFLRKLAPALTFAKSEDPRFSKSKTEGYGNIHKAAQGLTEIPDVEELKKELFPVKKYMTSSQLNQKCKERIKTILDAGGTPKIYELTIAPIDDLLTYYAKGGAMAEYSQYTYPLGYGSFNINEAIDRIYTKKLKNEKDVDEKSPQEKATIELRVREAAAKEVEDFLNDRFPATFFLEGYLATAHVKGKKIVDFNKMGAVTHKNIVGFLDKEDKDLTPLEREDVASQRGWNAPMLKKQADRLAQKANQKEKTGEGFLKGLEAAAQQASEKEEAYPYEKAVEFYKSYFNIKKEKKLENSENAKLSMIHMMVVNKLIQQTLSDETFAQLLIHPKELINPYCLKAGQRIVLDVTTSEKDLENAKGEKVKTRVFDRINTRYEAPQGDQKGTVFALQSSLNINKYTDDGKKVQWAAAQNPWYIGHDQGIYQERLMKFTRESKMTLSQRQASDPEFVKKQGKAKQPGEQINLQTQKV